MTSADVMKHANSADPAKYLPELACSSFAGATGKIEFDAKGDRKDAEVTIFTMKGGKTTACDEFINPDRRAIARTFSGRELRSCAYGHHVIFFEGTRKTS